MRAPTMQGFTLVELMIVIALIAILTSIAIPLFAHVLRKSQEASTKGNLNALRAAIGIYFTDHEGQYPMDDLTSLVSGNYLLEIPMEKTPPYHPGGNMVGAGAMAAQSDNTGNWYYFNVQSEQRFGTVVINCNHQDMNGTVWDTF